MALSERLTRLAARIEEAQVLKQDVNRGMALNSRLTNVQKVVDRATAVAGHRERLAEIGIAEPSVPLEYRVVDLTRSARAQSVEQPLNPDAHKIRDLDQSSERWQVETETVLLAAWQAYVDATVPKVSESLLQALRPIRGMRETVENIERELRRLDILRATLPANRPTRDLVAEVARLIAEEYTRLRAEDLPEEVRAFLSALSQRSATTARLTPTVMRWLSDNGLLDEFRVVPHA